MEALLNFKGPYPEDCSVVDVFPDFLAPLLSDLLRRAPRLLIERDLSRMAAGARWIVISAAIESGDSRLAEVILAGLEDRSIAVKQLVVGAIPGHACLQQPEVRPRLQRLLVQRSMSYCRDDIRRALNSLGKTQGGDL